ncbi:MAG: RNA polymerase sigma factor, partial [Solirubrobacterales bacterium]
VQLYEQHVSDVYGYFVYRFGSRAEAEALTAITFERAFGEWKTMRSDWDGAGVLLMRIARDASADRRPAPDSDDSGIAQDLAAALASLERRERSVLALRYGARLRGPQIARVLEMSETSVRRVLSRGLRRLRTELESPQGPRREGTTTEV